MADVDGAGGGIFAETAVGGRNAGHYLYVNPAFAKHKFFFGEDVAYAVNQDGDEVRFHLFGEIERAAVETPDGAVGRACSFGEDDDGIAAVYRLPQTG